MEYRMKKINEVTRGWINYYRIADMKRILTRIEDKIRFHIRMCYWKQWKTVKTERTTSISWVCQDTGAGYMPTHERDTAGQGDG